ncbi:MAG: hypothetical protein KH020_09815 [Clostridiales bacterium]|nr:hypothetical protein [Clostridiales bacterium]
MNDKKFAEASALSLLEMLKNGDTTSQELLEYYLDRVKQYNDKINAIIEINEKDARKRAKEADEARKRGESWGALHGLPITVKDVFLVKGFKIAAGTPFYKDYKVDENADVVNRLLDAGAIIYAKTNVPAWAGDWQTYNNIYGTTNNPYDLEKTCGGSSGGAAASLASGFTTLELGSDMGGSIRIPAHYCGVYGHRPTYGITSMYGHVPGDPGERAVPDLSASGGLARTADDLELLFDVIKGSEYPDNKAISINLPEYNDKELKDFKVCAWFDDDYCKVSSEMKEKYQELVDNLRKNGAIVDCKKPEGYSLEETYKYMRFLSGGIVATGLTSVQRVIFGFIGALLGLHKKGKLAVEWREYIRGMVKSHRTWLIYNEERAKLQHEYKKLYEEYDVLLMPVAPWNAFKHEHKSMIFRRFMIDKKKRDYLEHIPWIAIPTVMGFPASSVPIGLDKENMPVNVQVVSGPYEDKKCLRFGKLLEGIYGINKIPF